MLSTRKRSSRLLSDSSVQSLLTSLLLGSPAERDCPHVRGEVEMLSPERSLFPLSGGFPPGSSSSDVWGRFALGPSGVLGRGACILV